MGNESRKSWRVLQSPLLSKSLVHLRLVRVRLVCVQSKSQVQRARGCPCLQELHSKPRADSHSH